MNLKKLLILIILLGVFGINAVYAEDDEEYIEYVSPDIYTLTYDSDYVGDLGIPRGIRLSGPGYNTTDDFYLYFSDGSEPE